GGSENINEEKPVDDYLVRAVTTAGNVRGLACVTTHLVNEACQRQGASPTAAIALGRAMTGGVLMGALLKDDQRVALKFEGNGPLGKILVEADSGGGVRGGLGNPGVMLPPVNGRVDVAGALGRAGFLTVTKDIGLKRPYQGMVELYSSEIGEDLAYYLAESEQIPSAVGVAAAMAPDGSIAVAGGFLIQSLPPADEALIGGLVKGIEALSSLTDLLLQGATPEGLLALIMGDFPFEILGRQDLAFRCSCSRTRVRQVLATMDREELAATIAEEGAVEVVCEFCKTAYRFDSL
ncbi:MAG: Hsp33 family molecular chaperone HslO, partial [Desulfobulbaceae bacterium]|nr:Hsp33 family molecular chaperone HslO [Desulfobulbaceae bacterium]